MYYIAPDARVDVARIDRSSPSHAGVLLERVTDLRARAGDLVVPMGLASVPEGPVVVEGAAGRPDWVVMDVADDPQFRSGGLAIPPAVRRHLARVEAAGVVFDRLLIAHELPPGTVRATEGKRDPVSLIPAPRPDPAAVAMRDRMVRAVAAATTGLGRVGTAVGRTVASFGALDPALIGVLTPSGTAAAGETAALFLVAHWT